MSEQSIHHSSDGTMEVSTPSDTELRVTRSFAAPRERVLDAWTQPAIIKRWMFGAPGWTLPVCDIDLRVGGAYRFVWRSEDGKEMGMGGTYREIARPSRLVTTELFDEDWTGGETLVTLELIERDGGTETIQTVRYSSRDARDGALASGMIDGMAACFRNLDDLLAEEPSRL